MRQVLVVNTSNGRRYKVRYRLGGRETSQTFVRESDARMFRDILGDGTSDRVTQALSWLATRQSQDAKPTVTFGQFFEHYVDQLTGVTPRTRSDYRSMKRRYLSDLDGLPLTVINRNHVTSLVNRLEVEGRSPKTIKQTVHMLSTCLSLAQFEHLITDNACHKVRLPKATLAKVDARFLSAEEFATLLGAIPTHYKPLVTFLVGTGMRWSEATALQTRHIDIGAGTARVERAWKRVPGVGFEVGVPKTERANRTVNAATMALFAVKPLLGKPSDLVFTTVAGGPVRHANFFTNVWRPACLKAGLEPAPRIHDLRHTHASWLLSDGISLEAVQDQLGHESIETTRKVYARLIPAIGVAVGKAASGALERALAVEAAADVLPLSAPQVLEADLHHVEAHA